MIRHNSNMPDYDDVYFRVPLEKTESMISKDYQEED